MAAFDFRFSLRSRRAATVGTALLCLALAGALPTPAHAFWGLLGKAAGAAGKAGSAAKTAGTVGKGAAAGTVVHEGATAVKAGAGVADDAAHLGAGAGARGAGAELGTVNAALPPEVAAYLAKPVKDLTPRDTAALMGSYQDMVARAGRSGDFTAVERLPTSAVAARTLDSAPNAAPTAPPRRSAPAPAGAAPAADGAVGALPVHALRVLVHASHGGHRAAQQELDRVCRSGSVESRRFSPSVRASAEFVQACAGRNTRAAAR